MSTALRSDSLLLVGEKRRSRVVWIQFFDTSSKRKENDTRSTMNLISDIIIKERIKPGSARKFETGKLLYQLVDRSAGTQLVYCLFTCETSLNARFKKAFDLLSYRGGVYSAQRFFNELLDLYEDEKKLDDYNNLSGVDALKEIDAFGSVNMDVNKLGYLIGLADRYMDLDVANLEKIYFIVYEAIQMVPFLQDKDPDEFIDAAYLIAKRMLEAKSFHLSLELYKQIIPVAQSNSRFDLETACRLKISHIYYEYFPDSENLVIGILEPITEEHLHEAYKRDKESYYAMLGLAYFDNNRQKALDYFHKAIETADSHIASPDYMMLTYEYLGSDAESQLMYRDAARYYLTASTIAFTSGKLTKSSAYRTKASIVEIQTALSYIHAAIISRIEGDDKQSEYQAWDALRLTVKALQFVDAENLIYVITMASEVIEKATPILRIPGRIRQNKKMLNDLDKFVTIMQSEKLDQQKLEEELVKMASEVEKRIPVPDPTFLLISADGRLILKGEVTEQGWVDSEIEGVLLSGVISAIMAVISEVSDQSSSLRTVDAGNFMIMIENTENIIAVLLVDRDTAVFRKKLVELLHYVEEKYGDWFRNWSGEMRRFEDIQQLAATIHVKSDTTISR